MNRLHTITATALCLTLLSGCAYFDTGSTGPAFSNAQDAKRAALYKEATKIASDGRVLFFSPDENLKATQKVEKQEEAPKQVKQTFRRPASRSVEIFPLDQDMGDLIDPPEVSSVSAMPAHLYDPSSSAQRPVETEYPGEEPQTPTTAAEEIAQTAEAKEQTPDLQVSAKTTSKEKGPALNIYFSHDSSNLSKETQAALDELIAGYDLESGPVLKIEGHASKRTTQDTALARKRVNLKTSMERALSVTRYLLENGIPPEKIEPVAWGTANIGQNEDQARRVNIEPLNQTAIESR